MGDIDRMRFIAGNADFQGDSEERISLSFWRVKTDFFSVILFV
jgi:hypothetical protein